MENNVLLRFWVNSSMRNFHVTMGVLAVAVHMVGKLSKTPELFALADMVALFAIIHFFIHSYFHRQQKFLSDNQRVYSLPKKKIARTGSLFLIGFLVAVSVGMAVVKEIYSGTLLDKLKAMFFYLLGTLLGSVFDSDGLGRDELMLQDNTDLLGVMNQFSQKSDSPWDNLINSIQTILIVVGVIFLVVLCIMMIVNYVRRLIGGAKFDVKGQRGLDVNDREESLRGKNAKHEKILDFSPNAKARRIYRRSINRQRKRGQVVPEWMTPSEIENMVSLCGEEKHRELHQIYEKARYSETGCTEEDAQRAKALKV
ncbi:MAG: DUF4129 domain-containing protein [Bariatricus sp.]